MRSPLRSPFAPRVPLVGRGTGERVWTERCLGPEHPLTLALSAADRTREKLALVMAVALGGIALLLEGVDGGLALAIGALAVGSGLAVRLLVLAEARRTACLDLLAAGWAPGDIPALQRTWDRVARQRPALARSVDRLAVIAERPEGYLAGARPYFHLRVIRQVAPELHTIAALVASAGAPTAGVAFVERLMTCGTSSVYGADASELRADLARARFLLSGDA
jgi:hypothetical protein